MTSVVGTPTSGTQTTGTTAQTINLPTGLADGDLGLLVLTQNGTATLTPPAGWAQVGTVQTPSNALRVSTFMRTLTASLSGTAVTYSFSATQRSAKGIVVLRSALGLDVVAGGASIATDSTALSYPGLTPDANHDLLVALTGVRYATTANGVTQPSGWTELLDVADAATTAPRFGVSIATKQLVYGDGIAQAAASGSVPSTGINATNVVAVKPLVAAFAGWGQPI